MTPQLLSDEELTRWLAEETLALCAIPSVTGDEAAITDHLHARAQLQPHAEQLRVGNALVVRCGRLGGADWPVWTLGHGAAQSGAASSHRLGRRADLRAWVE
jgi:hypothetical protein